MEFSIVEAKNQLSQLIRAVEEGESVVITRNGRPVAQIVAPPRVKSAVVFDGMRGIIKLKPGWDDPIDVDEFVAGEL